MKAWAMRARIVRFGAVAAAALLLCGPAGAAPVTRTGVFKIVCTIVTDASIAKGSSFSLNVSARGSRLDAYQIVSTSISAVKSGASQTATITLPYKWTLTDTQKIVPIFLTVGTGTYPNTATVSQSVTIPTPANGATTTVAFRVRI
jgi:hypothetical protein